ncbi:MAG: RidA family protein [Candidatus Bathyarchaeia archaeon]
MSIESKLESLGLKLPGVPKPLGAYVPAVRIGDILFTSGQGPILEGKIKYQGKVGKDLTLEEGYEAAKLCALNCLSAIKIEIGSLDKIERIIKLVGFVNSAQGFAKQSLVINGASDLLYNLFGKKGKHVRVSVGVSELPNNMAVELELMVKIKSS